MEIRSGFCEVDGKPFTYEFCGGSERKYCSGRCYNTAKGRRQRKHSASRLWIVYGLADPRTGLFFYCGRTKSLGHRITAHNNPLAVLQSTNIEYKQKMVEMKSSSVRPTVTVFEETVDKNRENFYISELRKVGHPLVNLYQRRSL